MEPNKFLNGFNEIKEGLINIVSKDRLLQRQQFTQGTGIYGDNKIIEVKDGTKTFVAINKDGFVLNDGDNDRVLAGFQKGGFGAKDFGIKVSQDGYDVSTATDDQLVMSSAFNSFKIVSKGTATIALPAIGTGITREIPHNLGFVPTPLVYFTGEGPMSGSSSRTLLPMGLANISSPEAFGRVVFDSWYEASITSYALYINLTNANRDPSVVGIDVNFTYYLLRESL